jgi:SAM-dependent methyltransferase
MRFNQECVAMEPGSFDSGSDRPKGHIGVGVERALSRFYPGYTSETAIFCDRVSQCLNRNSVVLDAGCGSGVFFPYSWKNQVSLLVGCDATESVSRNPNLLCGVHANLADLPFASGSFDVIFSRYVLEHLEAPEPVFAEVGRVLRRGGKLVVLAPNKHHYVSLIGRLSPHWFHEMVGRIRGNQAHDLFPTRFRANSKKQLMKLAKAAGLCLGEYTTLETRPNYLMWSLPSFLFGVFYERAVNRFEALAEFRSSIIAVFERP